MLFRADMGPGIQESPPKASMQALTMAPSCRSRSSEISLHDFLEQSCPPAPGSTRPQFRADGNFELGELMPSVLSRMRKLLGEAAAAAQSWGNESGRHAASGRRKALSVSNGAAQVERWAVNKAVHYNEWAVSGRRTLDQ